MSDMEDVILVTDDGAHLTHALALHAALPVGSTEKSELPSAGTSARWLPETRVSALLVEPSTAVAKPMPDAAATVEKAPTPSSCEPDR